MSVSSEYLNMSALCIIVETYHFLRHTLTCKYCVLADISCPILSYAWSLDMSELDISTFSISSGILQELTEQKYTAVSVRNVNTSTAARTKLCLHFSQILRYTSIFGSSFYIPCFLPYSWFDRQVHNFV